MVIVVLDKNGLAVHNLTVEDFLGQHENNPVLDHTGSKSEEFVPALSTENFSQEPVEPMNQEFSWLAFRSPGKRGRDVMEDSSEEPSTSGTSLK